MLFSFILELFVFFCFGVAIIIIARTLPRMDDNKEDVSSAGNRIAGKIRNTFDNIPFDRLDDAINSFIHKMLRRLKIAIMKADNAVTAHLARVKEREEKRSAEHITTALSNKNSELLENGDIGDNQGKLDIKL